MNAAKRFAETVGVSVFVYLTCTLLALVGSVLYCAAIPPHTDADVRLSALLLLWLLATIYGLPFAVIVAPPLHMLISRYLPSWKIATLIVSGVATIVVAVGCSLGIAYMLR